MALASILYLAMVVCGFAAFMVVVAYGWLRTNPPWRSTAAASAAVVEARRPDAEPAKRAA